MITVTGVTNLGWVTGENSPNRTGSRFGIYGTDLGICWRNGRGEVSLAFGDTYGPGWGGDGAGPPGADWRWNVLAISTTRGLDGGLGLDDVVRRADGNAAQLLSKEWFVPEHTVIPTSGVTVGQRDYLHYMSVAEWGAPGGWRTHHGGIAYSDDGGRSWQRPRHARWKNTSGGDHPFQLVAFAGPPSDEEYLYLLGTPNGRFGDIRLARVGLAAAGTDDDAVLDPGAYRYWDGSGWSGDAYAATPVMSGPAGELSVQYNTVLRRWLALHLDEHRAAIVLRTAEELTGPWTDGEIVVSGREYPALYGGFLHPHGADRESLYFLMSQWGPYNVMLLRADLGEDGTG